MSRHQQLVEAIIAISTAWKIHPKNNPVLLALQQEEANYEKALRCAAATNSDASLMMLDALCRSADALDFSLDVPSPSSQFTAADYATTRQHGRHVELLVFYGASIKPHLVLVSTIKNILEDHDLDSDHHPVLLSLNEDPPAYGKALRRAAAGGSDVSLMMLHLLCQYAGQLPYALDEASPSNGFTAMHYAAARGHGRHFDLLKRFGASSEVVSREVPAIKGLLATEQLLKCEDHENIENPDTFCKTSEGVRRISMALDPDHPIPLNHDGPIFYIKNGGYVMPLTQTQFEDMVTERRSYEEGERFRYMEGIIDCTGEEVVMVEFDPAVEARFIKPVDICFVECGDAGLGLAARLPIGQNQILPYAGRLETKEHVSAEAVYVASRHSTLFTLNDEVKRQAPFYPYLQECRGDSINPYYEGNSAQFSQCSTPLTNHSIRPGCVPANASITRVYSMNGKAFPVIYPSAVLNSGQLLTRDYLMHMGGERPYHFIRADDYLLDERITDEYSRPNKIRSIYLFLFIYQVLKEAIPTGADWRQYCLKSYGVMIRQASSLFLEELGIRDAHIDQFRDGIQEELATQYYDFLNFLPDHEAVDHFQAFLAFIFGTPFGQYISQYKKFLSRTDDKATLLAARDIADINGSIFRAHRLMSELEAGALDLSSTQRKTAYALVCDKLTTAIYRVLMFVPVIKRIVMSHGHVPAHLLLSLETAQNCIDRYKTLIEDPNVLKVFADFEYITLEICDNYLNPDIIPADAQEPSTSTLSAAGLS